MPELFQEGSWLMWISLVIAIAFNLIIPFYILKGAIKIRKASKFRENVCDDSDLSNFLGETILDMDDDEAERQLERIGWLDDATWRNEVNFQIIFAIVNLVFSFSLAIHALLLAQ